MSETVEQAWFRQYGTKWSWGNIACVHFANGFTAGKANS